MLSLRVPMAGQQSGEAGRIAGLVLVAPAWDFTEKLIWARATDTIRKTIMDATVAALVGRPITIGPHCFGCTAGGGSSCGGTTVALPRD